MDPSDDLRWKHVFNSRIIFEGRPHFTHRLLFFNYVIFFKWSVPFFCPYESIWHGATEFI